VTPNIFWTLPDLFGPI